jgi:hypothetical protein
MGYIIGIPGMHMNHYLANLSIVAQTAWNMKLCNATMLG